MKVVKLPNFGNVFKSEKFSDLTDANADRRDLNASQRAMVAARLSDESGIGGDRQSGKHSANLQNALSLSYGFWQSFRNP